MMELIERAIPVIQHPPEARDLATLAPQPRSTESPTPVAAPQADCLPNDDSRRADDKQSADYEVALAGVHAALERLRLQHAQLTSGAILQTYHRQLTFEVEDSRPATRVVSVQV